MAFIIVAAGPMTDCRTRTITTGRALACLAVIALLLMSGCVALGYALAQRESSVVITTRGASSTRTPLEPTEALVLAGHVGDLSGRLTRLEIEAAALARRVGQEALPTLASESHRASLPRDDEDAPRGGPLLPLAGDAGSLDFRSRRVQDDRNLRLAQVEAGIARLEVSIRGMVDIVSDRELLTMAYPNHVPMSGRAPRISSGFGVRRDPFTGRRARHMGLDIPAAHGTAVLASGGGRVLAAGYRGPYGKAIVIDHGNGMQTLYGHCSTLYVRKGELVMPQQRIAAVGSTGRSTGPHLHFEVIRNGQRVEPGQVLKTVLARDTT